MVPNGSPVSVPANVMPVHPTAVTALCGTKFLVVEVLSTEVVVSERVSPSGTRLATSFH